MKTFKWILISLAALIVLIPLFYLEEDWRGKSAWENCKRESKARGESLDWNDYVPPPIPDNQNFFKAPKMQEWFVDNPHDSYPSTNELTLKLDDKKYKIITYSVGSRTNLINSADAARDYLAWSDQFKPDFDLIREALERPYARMDGDYTDPFEMPMPNFVNARHVAQMLAQRAHCYFLLGQPDDALQELTLLNDSRKFLEAAPTGQPMTIVSAMINVAVTGLYAKTIAEGSRSNVWREPQLETLQEQLAAINLLTFLSGALHEEPAALCHTFDILRPAKWYTMFRGPNADSVPRGWVYQNLVVVAKLEHEPLDGIDLERNTISPEKIDAATNDIDHALKSHSPFYFLAQLVPDFTKAFEISAYNQNLVNEAQIACALERYHLAHNAYPDTFDTLVPQYIQTIPHDIIGGQPLHYRRISDGRFLLYSIGWNEKDDGGIPSPHDDNGNITNYTTGNWVWPN